MEQAPMEQAPTQPLYWDKHRIPVNFTLLFAVAVAVFGLFQQAPLLIVAGVGVAGFSWFTNPRQYLIYTDALIVVYGRPRVRAIPFNTISRLEMRQLVTPDRLRVWLTSGRRVVLMARDPEAFHEKLESALEEFRRANPDQMIIDAPPPPEDQNQTPY